MVIEKKYYQNFLAQNPHPRKLKTYHLANFLNFSSNDYLGLSRHPLLISRAKEFMEKYGVGASSSRSVIGNIDIYETLENEIAKRIGKPAALILGSGFQANFSILEALLNKDVLKKDPLVFCDRWVHASILLGAKSAKSIYRFQHNDLAHLSILLGKHADQDRPKYILAESIYSMDGDEADLQRLTLLAQKHQAFLYIDDAHGIGLYGSLGWGKAANHADKIDLIMGTFSKALGSFGSYVACSEIVKEYLVNKCQGLIYSTALPPPVLGAIEAAFELLPELNAAREKVMNLSAKVRDFFQREGWNCGNSSTHIIPWIIGDPDRTLRVSQLLYELNILGVTIRPPSVPLGQSRIRFCISASHSEQNIDQLLEAIRKVERKL